MFLYVSGKTRYNRKRKSRLDTHETSMHGIIYKRKASQADVLLFLLFRTQSLLSILVSVFVFTIIHLECKFLIVLIALEKT